MKLKVKRDLSIFSELDTAAFTASSSTAPLRNMIFCFTGIADRKASLIKILKQMGADVEVNLTMDGNVLIAEEFTSRKYLVSDFQDESRVNRHHRS
jgi:hypothetical protein